ncbi:MAG TPA: hypothetical protein VF163_17540, partial [Micromonosporaceae bacterium]
MVAVGYTSGDPRKVSRTGDTMTGDLALLGDADLSTQDDATVGDDLAVGGDLSVGGTLTFTNLDVTNDATVGGDLDVAGSLTAQYQGVTGDVMQLLATALSTGVTSGGEFTPNADPTKLDISATTGWIVDYNSSAPFSPTNPAITHVSVPAQIGITPLVGTPNGVTWYLLDAAGTLSQQVATPSATQRRTHIVLGATAQAGGVIVVDQTLPVVQSQPA